jgi:hypothetical protein
MFPPPQSAFCHLKTSANTTVLIALKISLEELFFGCTPITNGLASNVLSILAPTSPSLLPKLLAIRGDAALTRIPIRTPEHHRVHHANATALSASPFSKKPIRKSPQFNRIYSFGTFV